MRGDHRRLFRDPVDPREVGFNGLLAKLLGTGLVREALVQIADLACF